MTKTPAPAEPVDVERSDDAFRGWMRRHLNHAAQRFGLTITGEPVFGWCLRSISAPAVGPDGPCWLRVGTERDRDLGGSTAAAFWTGIPDSAAITGIAKPRVLSSTEWAEPEQRRRVRADAMTLLPGRPCSPTDVLRFVPDLPDAWWTELRRSLEVLRGHPTDRFAERGQSCDRVRDVLGIELHIDQFETVHGDLHWNNVLGPDFGLLDWEMWGRGPAGMDAASLYLNALLVPDVASRVREIFVDVLDSPSGRVAQVRTAAAVLHRAEREPEYADLAEVLREHVRPLIDAVLPD
jgi:hypothetical protein